MAGKLSFPLLNLALLRRSPWVRDEGTHSHQLFRGQEVEGENARRVGVVETEFHEQSLGRWGTVLETVVQCCERAEGPRTEHFQTLSMVSFGCEWCKWVNDLKTDLAQSWVR